MKPAICRRFSICAAQCCVLRRNSASLRGILIDGTDIRHHLWHQRWAAGSPIRPVSNIVGCDGQWWRDAERVALTGTRGEEPTSAYRCEGDWTLWSSLNTRRYLNIQSVGTRTKSHVYIRIHKENHPIQVNLWPTTPLWGGACCHPLLLIVCVIDHVWTEHDTLEKNSKKKQPCVCVRGW